MTNTLQKLKKAKNKIDEKKFYTPTELQSEGLILNSKLEPSKFKALTLIREKKLPAQNVNAGSPVPRYAVLGSDVKKFLEDNYNL